MAEISSRWNEGTENVLVGEGEERYRSFSEQQWNHFKYMLLGIGWKSTQLNVSKLNRMQLDNINY